MISLAYIVCRLQDDEMKRTQGEKKPPGLFAKAKSGGGF
jgi:hypothetical protein